MLSVCKSKLLEFKEETSSIKGNQVSLHREESVWALQTCAKDLDFIEIQDRKYSRSGISFENIVMLKTELYNKLCIGMEAQTQ